MPLVALRQQSKALPIAPTLSDLERSVLEIAERIAKVPVDLQQMNKRAVHRQMELMGVRLRFARAQKSKRLHSTPNHESSLQRTSGRSYRALEARRQFGDYRTTTNDD